MCGPALFDAKLARDAATQTFQGLHGPPTVSFGRADSPFSKLATILALKNLTRQRSPYICPLLASSWERTRKERYIPLLKLSTRKSAQ
eukprot:362350-Chlamydomonas_euryale.AAC.1